MISHPTLPAAEGRFRESNSESEIDSSMERKLLKDLRREKEKDAMRHSEDFTEGGVLGTMAKRLSQLEQKVRQQQQLLQEKVLELL